MVLQNKLLRKSTVIQISVLARLHCLVLVRQSLPIPLSFDGVLKAFIGTVGPVPKPPELQGKRISFLSSQPSFKHPDGSLKWAETVRHGKEEQ